MENQFIYPYQNITHEVATAEQTVANTSVEHNSCNKKNIKEPAVLKHKEDIFVTNKDEHDDSIRQKEDENKLPQNYLNDSTKLNNVELSQYLPVDILKSVHRTLTSQPASSEGKIKFLRGFKHSLITEIGNALILAKNNNRNKFIT